MPPILEVRQLTKRYGALTAVNGIDLALERGRCLGLLGPNGAGKSTTMEMMEGINRPTSGTILYQGKPLGRTFRLEAGVQFQHTALQEFLTVKETLQLFRGLYPNPVPLDELVEQCALEPFLMQDNGKLSGGQRQRMLLAIALVNRPKILFLDEPTTGLDPQSRRHFWQLLRTIQAQQTTILLSTHYMEEAAELCDEIAIIDHGQIIAQGAPKALLAQHFNAQVIRLPHALLPPDWSSGEEQRIHGEWVEILSHDLNQTLQRLMAASIDLSRLQVRQHTLDDLFIQITGKELRQ